MHQETTTMLIVMGNLGDSIHDIKLLDLFTKIKNSVIVNKLILMEYIMNKRILTASSLFLLANIASAVSSGVHIGGTVGYANGRLESKYTFVDGFTTTENRDYAVTGFIPGGLLGYRYNISSNTYLDVSINAAMSNNELTEIIKANNVENRRLLIQLDYLLYPMITFGYSPSSETSIGIKAGYGQESWHSSLTDNNGINKKDEKSSGWLLGAEVLTSISPNVVAGLSASYSRIDEFTALINTDTTTCELCLAPETIAIAAVVHYFPKEG